MNNEHKIDDMDVIKHMFTLSHPWKSFGILLCYDSDTREQLKSMFPKLWDSAYAQVEMNNMVGAMRSHYRDY